MRESFYGDRNIVKQATKLGKYTKNTELYIHLKMINRVNMYFIMKINKRVIFDNI